MEVVRAVLRKAAFDWEWLDRAPQSVDVARTKTAHSMDY